MAYTVQFLKKAARELAALPERDRQRVARAIDGLAENPHPAGATALKGEFRGHYRIRTGDFRIIYFLEKKVLVVVVVRIGHRREVYRS